MVTVYVKHYLNDEGLSYFDTIWFSTVKAVISKQVGFISIDCKNIIVTFDSEDHLNTWAASKIHDDLVARLDKYRMGPWRSSRLDRDMQK